MPARDFLRHNWPAITIAVTAAAIACAALVMLQSMPPHQLVMATGPEGGAYYEVGQRYREVLARAGVDVKLVPTAGSVETLDRLRDPRSGVNVGLMQGGIAGAGSKSGLESLGTLFYEPLWWFRRREIQGVGVDGLRGRRVSIGPEGSGTRALALDLIKRTGVEQQIGEWLALAPRPSAEKLAAGEIDVAFMMTAWDSPVVRQLLSDDRIGLSSFPRADAFVALYPYLNKVVVPRGVADLAKDQPPSDVVLVATKASLIVREDLHSAIQYLLLNAAVELHSGASIFNRANEFPAAEAIDIPLSSEALRFYKSGSPFLHEYFPFWVAALIGKLIILLIPILGVLYPMMRSLPRLYDWMMRSKVLRMYGELRLLEDETESARRSGSDTRDMIARLDRLEQQANHLRVPVAYASMLYSLRDHIALVREGLNKHADKTAE
ncbi:MAG TPA: TAXI family TRAP transporter solute-binding subunit [Pseudolabrys sp.]|nr:TAXI family TRAP transporter solute-binding subunit [Pseudolabrys sp.]